ncbi:MAG: long-chain-acyl-CoA synthetase [Idiomarina sp.]|nr:long-chain-acyl-CoA synthetase [Idiomarina sp.]
MSKTITDHSESQLQAHKWRDIGCAILRFLPNIPRFIVENIRLKRAAKTDRGSPSFFFQQQAKAHPEQPFLRFQDREYSYGDFNQWVNQLAHALQEQGIERGDHVALMFENSPEQIACVFAVNKLGAVAGMVNYKQRGEVLDHSLQVVRPKLLVVGAGCEEALASSAYAQNSRIEVFYLNADQREETPEEYQDLAALAFNQPTSNPDSCAQNQLGDTCYFVFTSGTTGLPKAAAMTGLRWYKAGLGFGRMALNLKPEDCLYCALPLYHNTALAISLSSVVMTGSTLGLAKRFSLTTFWQDIQHYRATTFSYIGELCRYLLNAPKTAEDSQSGIRAVVGNGLRAEVWDKFQSRFNIPRICELYGASEGNVGFVNAFNLKRTVGFSPMTYAVVQFDVDTEEPIVDSQGRMQRVTKGDVGLLITEVSDKAPFDGYTSAEANAKKLLYNVFKLGDCWFNTGDLVLDQGFRHVAFIDRVGDTFRWKSENVATTEVEAQIHALADVVEAVVYGVKVPNTEGRAGMASIVLAKADAFDPWRFYAELKARLPDYAIPLFLRLAEQHETTTTFKIKKAELKRQSFWPEQVREPLFVLVDKDVGYQPLNPDLIEAIQAGRVRF